MWSKRVQAVSSRCFEHFGFVRGAGITRGFKHALETEIVLVKLL